VNSATAVHRKYDTIWEEDMLVPTTVDCDIFRWSQGEPPWWHPRVVNEEKDWLKALPIPAFDGGAHRNHHLLHAEPDIRPSSLSLDYILLLVCRHCQ
jgi:hypothetical protein